MILGQYVIDIPQWSQAAELITAGVPAFVLCFLDLACGEACRFNSARITGVLDNAAAAWRNFAPLTLCSSATRGDW